MQGIEEDIVREQTSVHCAQRGEQMRLELRSEG